MNINEIKVDIYKDHNDCDRCGVLGEEVPIVGMRIFTNWRRVHLSLCIDCLQELLDKIKETGIWK